MKEVENLIGKTFGKLKVIGREKDREVKGCKRYWKCECNCENKTIIIVNEHHLKTGHTKSCGCLQKEMASKSHHKINKYDLTKEYGIGWTSNNNQEFYFDLEDYDKIKDYCWFQGKHHNKIEDGYICAIINNKITFMHNLIMDNIGIDHKNRIKIDNRKENLRKSTSSQNSANIGVRKNNTSGITGVCWDKNNEKWIASIRVKGEKIWLGRFDLKKDAIIARLQAEMDYVGEKFAGQRNLFDKYNIKTTNNLR